MPELYLVRHAEPQLKGVMLGRTDCGLSEAGRRCAAETMPRLRGEIVYSSPLRRARETASFIAAPIVVLDELAEIGYGDWEGKRWNEIEATWPDLVRAKNNDWFSVTPPNGESWSDVSLRVSRAIERIRRGPFPAIVVAHFGLNAELMRQLQGTEPLGFNQQYCEVIRIEL